MELKERIECLMAESGLSVQEIARVAGVSPSAVYQWLGKTSNPVRAIGRIEAALALQEATGFNALWIAKGEGEKYKSSPDPESESLTRQSWLEKARRAEDELIKALLQEGLSIDAIEPTKNHIVELGVEPPRKYQPDLALRRSDGSVLLVEIKVLPFRQNRDEKSPYRSPASELSALRNRLLELMLGDNFVVVRAGKEDVKLILERLSQEPNKAPSTTTQWPFTSISQSRWTALTERVKGRIEAKFEVLLEQAEAEQAANSRAA